MSQPPQPPHYDNMPAPGAPEPYSAPPHAAPPTYADPPPAPAQKSNTGLLAVIGVLVLILAAGGAWMFLGGDDAPVAPVASQAATSPADPATDIAESSSDVVPVAATTERRYADSPGDGFLALRSDPGLQTGSRIGQIPHGAPVEVGACDEATATVGGKSGRWCPVEYDGQSGYVFDAYLASSQPAPRTAPRAPSASNTSRPEPGPTREAESMFKVTGAEAFSVRTHPSVNAPRAGTIPRNGTFTTSVCEVSERREGGKSRSWCYAEGSGVEGWVSVNNDFLTLIAG